MHEFVLNNGMNIPVIGYGTFPNKEALEKAIPVAVSKGFRLIDTSDNYLNEINVGNAYSALSEEDRKGLVILTKYSNPLKTPVFNSVFESSVKKIYKDANHDVDIYLLHWPYPHLWKKQWRKMEKLYSQGRCKAIGVCNFEKDKLEELLKFAKVKPMINQIECHPMFQQNEIVEFCKANEIQIMSYSPFARMDKRLTENKVLTEIAVQCGKNVLQVILRWNYQRGFIPIPASTSEKHIESNIDIFDFSLSDEQMEKINELDSGMRIRFDPKTRFTMVQRIIYKICSLFS